MKTLKNTCFWTILLAFFLQTGFGQAKYQAIYTAPYNEYVITATTTTQQQHMVFTGIIRNSFSINPNAPAYNLFIRKTDVNGSVDWSRTIDVACELYPNSLRETEDEGFIIAGTVSCTWPNMTTMFLLKLDRDGQVDWIKYYDRNYWDFEAGTVFYHSELQYAEEAINGGIIATGFTEVFNPATQQSHNATIVLLTDNSGNLINRKILNTGDLSQGITIKKVGTRGYALLTETVDQQLKPSVIFLDKNLKEVWNKTISQGINYLFPRDLVVTNQEEIIITSMLYDMMPGNTFASLVSLNIGNGGVNWQKSYYWKNRADTYFPESIKVGKDGDLFLAGEIQYEFKPGQIDDDVFVLQTDNKGQLKRVTQYGQPDRPEYVEEISTFSNGEFFFGGFISYFNSSGYLVKANANGNSGCDQQNYEGKTDNYTYTAQSKVLQTISSNIYVNLANASSLEATINPERCGSERRSERVTHLDNTTIIQPAIDLTKDHSQSMVYPNPNNGTFNLVLPKLNNQKIALIQLYNANGQLIKEVGANNDQPSYNFQDYSKGVYFLKITDGVKTESHKIIVQ